MSIWMALHNRNIKKPLGSELTDLMEALDDKKSLALMTESDAKQFMAKTYELLSNHEVLDSEASINLK